MVRSDVLLGNLAALALVWGWTLAAGVLVSMRCRRPFGLAGSVLFGLAFWAVALYLLPVRGGLLVVMLAVAAGVGWAAWVAPARVVRSLRVGWGPAVGLLFVGGAVYTSLLLICYVPPGMDAAMHATAGRLIGAHGGLPANHAPFASELRLPPINLGLPTLAACAVRCGASAPSAFLAAESLTFAAFVLAVYLLLRSWVRATPAAVLAVFAVWGARSAQETVAWGGVPTITSVAVGIFAGRLLLDSARGGRWRAGVPLGMVVASLPLLHGVGAATWGYAVAPVALLVAVARVRSPRRLLATLATAAAVAALFLGSYVVVASLVGGRLGNTPENLEWTRRWQMAYAPRGDGWHLVRSVASYLITSAGPVAVWPGLAAIGLLLAARRFAPAGALVAVMLLLGLVAANARSWTLPFSFLLYPERVVYWMTPLSACALAVAWRAVPARLRSARGGCVGVAAVMIILAGLRHAVHFQGIGIPHLNWHDGPVLVHTPPGLPIGADDWEVLEWARQHLEPTTCFVEARYPSVGSYLPCAAGLATTGWHVHIFLQPDGTNFMRSHRLTHQLVACGADADAVAGARVVFENRTWRLLELPGHGPPGRVSAAP